MTKICHITSVHKQFDTRIFIKECCSLSKNGFDTKLLVLNGESCVKDGVEVISVKVPLKNRLTRIFKASKAILKKAIEIKADVYHLHDPELLRIALKLKSKTGAKIIYDSHEDLPKQIMDKHWIPKVVRKSLS
ncbi:MAG: glycosyltransferase family 1 protein, partial [Bacteroidota bacterium]